MTAFNNAAAERQRKRWMRPDAHLYVRPDAVLWQQPNQQLWQRPDLAECKYSPDQPRVPAGSHEGGQRTSEGSTGRIRLAGEIPTDDPPEIPKERPANSADRTAAQKLAARLLGPAVSVAELAKLGAWFIAYAPQIISYYDPPKLLEELQQAVSTRAPGYDIHHIVEQSSAEEDGFTRDVIDSPNNLVRIPRIKHWEINAWYQTANRDFGGLTPREYLSGRNWEIRRSVGLEALTKAGVLKP
jgi:hypothetical protein